MFTPSLTKGQRQQAADIRTRLAAALEPTIIQDNPKLAVLVTTREELTLEIAGIERGAGAGNLEEAAQLLSNRRTQLHLVQLHISELQGARTKAEELAQQKTAETLNSVYSEARPLLIEIATSFATQHRAALEQAIGQYVQEGGHHAHNVAGMIPWFLQYRRNIRAFETKGIGPNRLLQWLGEALECRDFLMARP
jgi:hypothetical protein